MSKYRGPNIPAAFRSGPAPPSKVIRGPVQYRLDLQESKPWVEKIATKGETKKSSWLSLWIRNNPRKAHHLFLTTGLLIFFSRPLYDIFIRKSEEPTDIVEGFKSKQKDT